MLIENANKFILAEEKRKEIDEKRTFFLTEFSKEKIANLEKDHYYQGKGVKQGNFTYELEWNSRVLGGIGGGSVYKFGYDEDFVKIKKYLVKVLSGKDEIKQFYKDDGELTEFAKDIINDSEHIKGVGRAFIGKVLSIYYPETFINIFGHQDFFLEQIYEGFQAETYGVELFMRNNYLLLEVKKKVAPDLSNYEFAYLLYQSFDKKKADDSKVTEEMSAEEVQIKALEVQHYQSLIHRNFTHLFKHKLKYYDEERQNENIGHFDTQEVGIMDILAVDNDNNLVVIELKRESSDKTLGQILRYMGWAKKNLCKKGQEVKGIIIAETKDNRLDYALTITPNVTFKKMTLNVEID